MSIAMLVRASGSCLLAGALVALFATSVQATSYPNIDGEFSGSGTETVSQCFDPADEGTFSGSALVNITQNPPGGTNMFSGSGTVIDTSESFFFSGSIQMDGTVNGSWSSGSEGGTFIGGLSGNTLTISYQGSGPDCNSISGSATLQRTTDPSVSGGAEITPDNTLRSDVDRITERLRVRVRSVQKGDTSGALEVPDGFLIEGSGLAAGDSIPYPYGVWGSYSYSEFDDSFASTRYGSDQHSFLGGVDVSPREGVIFGVALGYATTDTDTLFNSGEEDTDAFTIAPYLGAVLTDVFSLDFSAGYSSLDIDQFRGGATRITSSVDGDRYFLAGNFNAARTFGDWYVSGHSGVLWALQDHDAYTESDGTGYSDRRFKLGQFRIGAEVAYTYQAWEPYARATFQYDYSQTDTVFATGVSRPESDRSDLFTAFGVRYFAESGLSGGFEYNTVFGRSNFDEDTYNLFVRWDF